jgi:hypothetical protein
LRHLHAQVATTGAVGVNCARLECHVDAAIQHQAVATAAALAAVQADLPTRITKNVALALGMHAIPKLGI